MDLDRRAQQLGQRPALIVVDVVRGFTDPACPLGVDCPEVVAAVGRLMDAWHQQQLPVVLTTVVYHSPAEASVFRDRLPALNVLTPDSAWVEIDPRLPREKADLLLEKRWASAFFDTTLKADLARDGVDSLAVVGLTTSGCVRATVVDGLQHNYPVLVPREAVGDRNREAHAANLADMHAKYAEVVTVDEVIAALAARTAA